MMIMIMMMMVIIIIERISRAPFYRTRWERRAFYNNAYNTHSLSLSLSLSLSHTHTHTHTHTRTHTHHAPHTHTQRMHARTHTHTNTLPHPHPQHIHVGRGDRHGCEKDSLEIVIEQVRLEGGFKRGGRIRVAECLRQIVPNRWASGRN